jgi:hypothetical protein
MMKISEIEREYENWRESEEMLQIYPRMFYGWAETIRRTVWKDEEGWLPFMPLSRREQQKDQPISRFRFVGNTVQ